MKMKKKTDSSSEKKKIKGLYIKKKGLEKMSTGELIVVLEKYCFDWEIRTDDSWFEPPYICDGVSKHIDAKTDKLVGGDARGHADTVDEAIIECIEELSRFGELNKGADDIDAEHLSVNDKE